MNTKTGEFLDVPSLLISGLYQMKLGCDAWFIYSSVASDWHPQLRSGYRGIAATNQELDSSVGRE